MKDPLLRALLDVLGECNSSDDCEWTLTQGELRKITDRYIEILKLKETRECGTCSLWDRTYMQQHDVTDEDVAACTWEGELPSSIDANDARELMYASDGTNCQCWNSLTQFPTS